MRTMSRISSSDLPSVAGDAAAGWAGAAAGCAAAGLCATGLCPHEASARDAATTDTNTVSWNSRFIVAPRKTTLREKIHQFRVHAIRVCPQDTVRPAGEFDKLDVLDHFRLPPRGGIRRQYAVGVAVQDERRDF